MTTKKPRGNLEHTMQKGIQSYIYLSVYQFVYICLYILNYLALSNLN